MYESKIDNSRQRQRERDRDRERDDKAQGIVPYFFLLNKAVWKKQDHSFQSSILVKI